MISVYTSAFNLENSIFDLEDSLKNYLSYADEVVISTMPCKDKTCEILKSKESDRVKVVYNDFSFEDPLFVGKLKNSALQSCSGDVCIQQDLDERIFGRKDIWEHISEIIRAGQVDSFFVPVLNLFKDKAFYSSIRFKWYIHKKEGAYRGVVNFAKLKGGKIDTEKSDTCELINENGDLFDKTSILCRGSEEDILNYMKDEMPFIVHYGYVDLDKRIDHNKFWKPVWENRAGKPVDNIVTSKNNFNEQIKKHGLKI